MSLGSRSAATMTTNIAILKVLSSYPGGQASLDALKRDLAMLSTREWSTRMRALSALAGPISLFGDKLVNRDSRGWTITTAGRDFLEKLEHRARILADKPDLTVVASSTLDLKPSQQQQVNLRLVRSA
jgi:hypothetical protein